MSPLFFDPRGRRGLPSVASVATVASPPTPGPTLFEQDPALSVDERILGALAGRRLTTRELAVEIGAPAQAVYEALGRLLTARTISTDPGSFTYALAGEEPEAPVPTPPVVFDPRSGEDGAAQGRAELAVLDALATGPLSVEDLLGLVAVDEASTPWAIRDLEAAGLVKLEAGSYRISAPPERLARLGLGRYAPRGATS